MPVPFTPAGAEIGKGWNLALNTAEGAFMEDDEGFRSGDLLDAAGRSLVVLRQRG